MIRNTWTLAGAVKRVWVNSNRIVKPRSSPRTLLRFRGDERSKFLSEAKVL